MSADYNKGENVSFKKDLLLKKFTLEWNVCIQTIG